MDAWVIQKGAKDHAHMLGCGYSYFKGRYPDAWAVYSKMPFEEAAAAMIEFYELVAAGEQPELP